MDTLYPQWLKSQGIAESTIKHYTSVLARFLSLGVSTKDFSDEFTIKRAFIKLYPHKPITLVKYKVAIERYSDFLVENYGYKKIKLNSIKVGKRLPYSLTKEQIDEVYRVTQSLTPKSKLMLDVLLYTGIRRKELCNLLISDLRDEGIHIRSGKGDKDRFVYCPYTLIYRMRAIAEGERVFKINPDGVSCMFRRIQAKLPFRFFPHLLRHSFATFSIKSGIDIYTLQRMLGHSSIETTSVYLHMNSEQTKQEMRKLRII